MYNKRKGGNTVKRFSVSELLSADIGISSIERIYESKSGYWYRPDKYPRDYEGLLYFFDGAIRYELGDTVFEANAGQVLRLPKGVPYSGLKLTDGEIHYVCIDFTADREGAYDLYPLPYSFTPSDRDQTARMFLALEKKWHTPSPAYLVECKRDLLSLIGYLTKDHANNLQGYSEHSRVLSVCEYIADNMQRHGLTVAEVARAFHISESQLRRIFMHEMEVSPLEYLISVRIESAKRMLVAEKDMSVEEIALACGYSSLYYFSSAFSERVGCAPSEYRKRLVAST